MWEESLKHVKQTLDVLKGEKLYVKLLKCAFGKTSLNYLGHIVGGGELKIDPSKVTVIVNWPKPKYATEVRSFLGVAQYWRKFISNFSLIATPLHALTGLDKVFQWGGKQQKSFDTLKEKTSIAPVLALPDLQRPFEIETDVIDYAMGVVCSTDDTVLDRKVRTTCRGDVEYLRIKLKGSNPSNAKWIEIEQERKKYPHLIDS
eukprot:PITA_25038